MTDALPRGRADDRLAIAVLASAFAGHVLLFVRIAVLFAPALYLGPSGSDRLFYFDYVRSIVIDGDLDFLNEIAMRPPSTGVVFRAGHPVNKYPIGSPLLSLPAYAATHAVLSAVARPAGSARTGFERPYVYAYALSQFAFGLLGTFLLFRVLRRYFDPLASAIGVTGAAFGTELLRYTSADLMMSHAASFFSLSLCLLESVRLTERPGRAAQWFRCGASAAFILLVRFQNASFLLVPAVAVLVALVRSRRWREGAAASVTAAIAGAAAILALQVLAWRLANGSWIANGYSEEISFAWLAPHGREVVVLLSRWLPVLAVGGAGTLLAAGRRRDPLLGAVCVSFLAAVYITASWWAYGIAPRTTFDNLAFVAVGLAAAAAFLRRRVPALQWAVAVVPGIWNVPFMMLPVDVYARAGTLLADWYAGVRLLL